MRKRPAISPIRSAVPCHAPSVFLLRDRIVDLGSGSCRVGARIGRVRFSRDFHAGHRLGRRPENRHHLDLVPQFGNQYHQRSARELARKHAGSLASSFVCTDRNHHWPSHRHPDAAIGVTAFSQALSCADHRFASFAKEHSQPRLNVHCAPPQASGFGMRPCRRDVIGRTQHDRPSVGAVSFCARLESPVQAAHLSKNYTLVLWAMAVMLATQAGIHCCVKSSLDALSGSGFRRRD